MNTFNGTLWSDIQGGGQLKMAAKSFYPLQVPQQPDATSSRAPPGHEPIGRRHRVARTISPSATPPCRMAALLLLGWLIDLSKPDAASAQVLGKRYFGNVDEAGARDVAHQFSADILAAVRLQEPDRHQNLLRLAARRQKKSGRWTTTATNQKQFTHYGSISITPAVSADGIQDRVYQLQPGTAGYPGPLDRDRPQAAVPESARLAQHHAGVHSRRLAPPVLVDRGRQRLREPV